VGQGLAGSTLAVECIKRGKRVCVVDEPANNRASVISAGICNPITGKAMTRSYLAERIFPFLQSWYPEAERLLGKKFFRSLPVYRPFVSSREQEQWAVKTREQELQAFAKVRSVPYLPEKLANPFGGLEVSLSGVLDVAGWVNSVRDLLADKEIYCEAHFDEHSVRVGKRISWQDIDATHLIFCNGVSALQSKWFSWLPVRPLKGETLTVRMEFQEERIISRGAYVVPSLDPGIFVVGSTYDREPFSVGVTAEGRARMLQHLEALIRTPVEVLHQNWGIRPTVSDRRPLLGSHPQAGNVIIFNGLGTKGVSLAPYFASTLLDWLEGRGMLPEEVNISRFKSLYSN
jgi:glycine/D-amino acid oxidase-like deaminating enzyme